MVKCYDCGWIGEPDELEVVQESRGEFWGIPCSETMYYCSCCGGDYIDEYKEDEEDGEKI